MSAKKAIEKKVNSIRDALVSIVTSGTGKSIIQAPPGSGKTRLLSEVAIEAAKMNLRIAVATQTKGQADELCDRIIQLNPKIRVIRYISSKDDPNPNLSPKVVCKSDIEMENSACVVVGTSAKWGLVSKFSSFDLLFIEEAWQMSYASFLLLADRIAPCLVMIGDPGQIPPVVTIPTHRWSTHEKGPHLAAPLIVAKGVEAKNMFALPATRRLPSDTAELIKDFYDFSFESYAEKGEKRIKPMKMNTKSVISKALGRFENGSVIGMTVRTPKNGPPQVKDNCLIEAAIKSAQELVNSKAEIYEGSDKTIITAADIGIVATHRTMVNSISLSLPSELRGHIRVDTPERWQGLERKAMIAIHPLSGTTSPSNFDLETGRLCVMASRHKSGLILLTRDHLSETLDNCFPEADQPFGSGDISGKGHFLNEQFWNSIIKIEQVVSVDEDVAA